MNLQPLTAIDIALSFAAIVEGIAILILFQIVTSIPGSNYPFGKK